MMAMNKDEVKRGLRDNQIVYGPRGIGKTQALIEIIHEDHFGNAMVACLNNRLSEVFIQRYRNEFPNDKVPMVASASNAQCFMGRDISIPLYADCYGSMTDKQKDDLSPMLTAAIF